MDPDAADVARWVDDGGGWRPWVGWAGANGRDPVAEWIRSQRVRLEGDDRPQWADLVRRGLELLDGMERWHAAGNPGAVVGLAYHLGRLAKEMQLLPGTVRDRTRRRGSYHGAASTKQKKQAQADEERRRWRDCARAYAARLPSGSRVTDAAAAREVLRKLGLGARVGFEDKAFQRIRKALQEKPW
jgi:hypothetical protein